MAESPLPAPDEGGGVDADERLAAKPIEGEYPTSPSERNGNGNPLPSPCAECREQAERQAAELRILRIAIVAGAAALLVAALLVAQRMRPPSG